uniref:DM5 domain-containing protein n=1 Tax=Rhabditophanes sp. KR3021 TaxID=114890 RepID=A0AC35U085_9BILA
MKFLSVGSVFLMGLAVGAVEDGGMKDGAVIRMPNSRGSGFLYSPVLKDTQKVKYFTPPAEIANHGLSPQIYDALFKPIKKEGPKLVIKTDVTPEEFAAFAAYPHSQKGKANELKATSIVKPSESTPQLKSTPITKTDGGLQPVKFSIHKIDKTKLRRRF